MLLAACGSDTSPSSTPASLPSPTTAASVAVSPTATSGPAPTASKAPAGWLAAPVQPSLSDLEVRDLIWTGTRFVGAGSDPRDRVVILDSSDGLTWHRQLPLGPGGGPVSLAAGPGGVVAVGGRIEGSNGAVHQVSWFSPSGLAWKAYTDTFRTASGARSRGSVLDVVATLTGWLAVGGHDPSCTDPCNPDRAVVWTSTNGTDWTEIPDASVLHTGFMETIARDGSGFVAIGQATEPGFRIWTSPDGLAWSSVPGDATFGGASLTGVAVHGGVAVVVGATDNADLTGFLGQAWWSSSGGPWMRAAIEGVTDLPIVAATPDGFLATGGLTGGCLGGIWSSTDGRAWVCDAPAAGFDGLQPVVVAAADSIEVAITAWHGGNTPGIEATPPPGVGAIWYRLLR